MLFFKTLSQVLDIRISEQLIGFVNFDNLAKFTNPLHLSHWRRSVVFIVNFEHNSYIFCNIFIIDFEQVKHLSKKCYRNGCFISCYSVFNIWNVTVEVPGGSKRYTPKVKNKKTKQNIYSKLVQIW